MHIVEFNFTGTSSSMAHHCQLSPSIHLVSGFLGQTTRSRCSDRPAPHHYPPSTTSTNPTRACLYPQPFPGHLLGSLQALEGPNAPASSARQSLILARSAVGPASSVTWGVGVGQPACSSVGGQTRLRIIRCFATKHPLALNGLTCRPRLLPMPTSGQKVDGTLQVKELRWVAAMQPSSRGTARLSSEMSASLPAWMTPSQTPRLHWSDQQQQRQEQHQEQMQQQPAPQLPLNTADADDIIDAFEACGSHPQQAHWGVGRRFLPGQATGSYGGACCMAA